MGRDGAQRDVERKCVCVGGDGGGGGGGGG